MVNTNRQYDADDWVSDPIHPGLQFYVPGARELERQYQEDSARIAPEKDAAAIALLKLALVHVDVGYPLTVALRLAGIEEVKYDSVAEDQFKQRIKDLRKSGVREGHLESPADRALWNVWNVVWPNQTPRERLYCKGLAERESELDAARILQDSIDLISQEAGIQE